MIDKLHHMKTEEADSASTSDRGNNIWPAREDTPATGVCWVQDYKGDDDVFGEQEQNVVATRALYGSGGSGAPPSNAVEDSKDWIAPCSQFFDRQSHNSALLRMSVRDAPIALYRTPQKTTKSKDRDCNQREYLGVGYVGSVTYGEVDEEKRKSMEERRKSKSHLQNVTFLMNKVAQATVTTINYDEDELRHKSPEGARYLFIDGDSSANDMFHYEVATEEFEAATIPAVQDDGSIDTSNVVTAQKVAFERLKELSDIQRFVHPCDCEHPEVWNGSSTKDRTDADCGCGDLDDVEMETGDDILVYDDGMGEECASKDAIPDNNETNDNSVPPFMEMVCNQSVRVNHASDARALGFGQQVLNGETVPKVLPARRFGKLGAILRVNPIPSVMADQNITAARFIRSALAANPLVGPVPAETYKQRAYRSPRDVKWAHDHETEVADHLCASVVNQLVSQHQVWQMWAKTFDPKCSEADDEFHQWCHMSVAKVPTLRLFIEKLLTVDGYMVSSLNSGQYQQPYNDPQQLLDALEMIYRKIGSIVHESLHDGDELDRRSNFIKKLSKGLADATGVGVEDGWAFPVSQSMACADQVMNYVLGEPRAETIVCGKGSRKGTKRTRREMKTCEEEMKVENKKKWTDAECLQELLRCQKILARTNEDFRVSHGIVIENGEPVEALSGKPLDVVTTEQMYCEVLKRSLDKTIANRITGQPDGYTSYTTPNLSAGEHALSAECRKATEQRFYGVTIETRPNNLFCLPTEKIPIRESDVFESENESDDEILEKAHKEKKGTSEEQNRGTERARRGTGKKKSSPKTAPRKRAKRGTGKKKLSPKTAPRKKRGRDSNSSAKPAPRKKSRDKAAEETGESIVSGEWSESSEDDGYYNNDKGVHGSKPTILRQYATRRKKRVQKNSV
jgi:hypothetical protein